MTMTSDALRAANSVVPPSRRADERVNAASFVGLWLLLPIAIGGVARLLLGLLVLILPGDFSVPTVLWLVLTLVLQAGFWALVCQRSGQPPAKGLWALIPVVAFLPTFFIARRALLAQRV
jgi:hypothetical protein